MTDGRIWPPLPISYHVDHADDDDEVIWTIIQKTMVYLHLLILQSLHTSL